MDLQVEGDGEDGEDGEEGKAGRRKPNDVASKAARKEENEHDVIHSLAHGCSSQSGAVDCSSVSDWYQHDDEY